MCNIRRSKEEGAKRSSGGASRSANVFVISANSLAASWERLCGGERAWPTMRELKREARSERVFFLWNRADHIFVFEMIRAQSLPACDTFEITSIHRSNGRHCPPTPFVRHFVSHCTAGVVTGASKRYARSNVNRCWSRMQIEGPLMHLSFRTS